MPWLLPLSLPASTERLALISLHLHRGQQDRAPDPQWLLFPRVQCQPGSTPGTLTRTPWAPAWPARQPQQRPGQVCAPTPTAATGSAHGEGGHREVLEPRLGDSCLRTLTQGEEAVPDAMPAPGLPNVTSVPSTSVPWEGAEPVGCLHLPRAGCPREPVCARAGCQPRDGCAARQGSSGGCQPCPGAACMVLAVTLVSQGQVRESNNGPSTPQGGLWVHRGLCVKQGVTSTCVPSKVLPCSQNKQRYAAVPGAAAGAGARPPPHPCSLLVPSLAC